MRRCGRHPYLLYAASAFPDAAPGLQAKAVGLRPWCNRSWVATCKAASSTLNGPPLSWHLQQIMVVLAALMVTSLLVGVAVLPGGTRVTP